MAINVGDAVLTVLADLTQADQALDQFGTTAAAKLQPASDAADKFAASTQQAGIQAQAASGQVADAATGFQGLADAQLKVVAATAVAEQTQKTLNDALSAASVAGKNDVQTLETLRIANAQNAAAQDQLKNAQRDLQTAFAQTGKSAGDAGKAVDDSGKAANASSSSWLRVAQAQAQVTATSNAHSIAQKELQTAITAAAKAGEGDQVAMAALAEAEQKAAIAAQESALAHRELSIAMKDAQGTAGAFTNEVREGAATLTIAGEAIGVTLPRHVRTFIASMPGVGAALSAAFDAFAVFFLIDALVKLGEKLGEITADTFVYTEAMKEEYAQILKVNAEHEKAIDAFRRLRAERELAAGVTVYEKDATALRIAHDQVVLNTGAVVKLADAEERLRSATEKYQALTQRGVPDTLLNQAQKLTGQIEDLEYKVPLLGDALRATFGERAQTPLEQYAKDLTDAQKEIDLLGDTVKNARERINAAREKQERDEKEGAEKNFQATLSAREANAKAQIQLESAKNETILAAQRVAFAGDVEALRNLTHAEEQERYNSQQRQLASQAAFEQQRLAFFKDNEARFPTEIIATESKIREIRTQSATLYQQQQQQQLKEQEDFAKGLATVFEKVNLKPPPSIDLSVIFGDVPKYATDIEKLAGSVYAAGQALQTLGIQGYENATIKAKLYEAALDALTDAQNRARAAAQAAAQQQGGDNTQSIFNEVRAREELIQATLAYNRAEQETTATAEAANVERAVGVQGTFSLQEKVEQLTLSEKALAEATEVDSRFERALNEVKLERLNTEIALGEQSGQNVKDLVKERDAVEDLLKSTNRFNQGINLTFKAFQTDLKEGVNLSRTFSAVGVEAFNAFGQATANAFTQAILGQKSLGLALREGLAQALATIAGQAIVKAIFYTAEGFAALATGDTRGAADYFIAAGLMGGVGAVAAVAARAINPPQASGSTGATVTATSGTPTPAQQPEQQPVQTTNVQHFATGGVVTQPTRAEIGEGGEAEAILPLTQRVFRALAEQITALEPPRIEQPDTIKVQVEQPPPVQPTVEQPTVKPVIEQPPVIYPQVAPAIVNPQVQPTNVVPVVSEATVRPVVEQPMITPQVNPAVVNPIVNNPLVNAIVRPLVESATVRPQVEQPTVRPVVENPAIRAFVENPTIRPLIEPLIRANVETPTIRPDVEQPTISPRVNVPAITPLITQPTLSALRGPVAEAARVESSSQGLAAIDYDRLIGGFNDALAGVSMREGDVHINGRFTSNTDIKRFVREASKMVKSGAVRLESSNSLRTTRRT